MAVVLDIALRRSRRRPASPNRRRGHRCRVYNSPDVAWWRSVGPAGQGLAYIRAPAVMRHVAVPYPPGRGAGVCTKEVRESHGGPGPLEGGGPGLRLPVLSIPPWGTWRRRTPSRAGGGPGAIHVVRWSPDSRSWQNSNGSCAEHISSRVAGPTVLPQHPGWRSSDRSWRTGLRSQPLWGMAA